MMREESESGEACLAPTTATQFVEAGHARPRLFSGEPERPEVGHELNHGHVLDRSA
jgi:hypothetical protein